VMLREAWRAGLALATLAIVLGVASTFSGESAGALQEAAGQSPSQKMLQELWERPFVSTVLPAQRTQMLWNAMEDANVDMHSSMSRGSGDGYSDSYGGGGDDDSSDDDGVDSGNESYEKYDTDSGSGGNGDDGMDSALKSIIPSSEREGTGLSSRGSHEWDTSELSDNDGWDKHSSSDDTDSDSSSGDGTNSAWLKQHSWESSKDAQLKADIKKMYHNGINKISKSIAKQADNENKNSFYSKWAGGKALSSLSGSKGSKTPLSNSDMKLYKEAESSVKKEEEKKAPLIKAVKSADSKDESSEKSGGAGASKDNHSKEVKAKLEAADRLSKHIAKKQHKTSVKDLLKQSARIAVESKKAHGKKAKAAVEANAKKLQEEIKEDFSHATAIADNIQSTANKLVGSKLKSSTQSV